jgi:ring-1,2-phenylacetyl-CoA epoxidase subunit PaaC
MASVCTDAACQAFSLAHADDTLILAQQLGSYLSFSPEVELDMAVGNISLDLLGQARVLYTHFGDAEGSGRSEDDLAMFRNASEFQNLPLVEAPHIDFGGLIARQLLFDAYQVELYGALVGRGCSEMDAIAEKGLREARYHLDFSQGWVLRLGDGTVESHARMQSAIDRLWATTAGLFEGPTAFGSLEKWRSVVVATLDVATLNVPSSVVNEKDGRGMHSESFEGFIAELQQLQRANPGLSW